MMEAVFLAVDPAKVGGFFEFSMNSENGMTNTAPSWNT